jgi:hypothetical protein
MSYNIKYNLAIEKEEPYEGFHFTQIKNIYGYYSGEYFYFEYNIMDDLIEYSLKYPDVIFKLYAHTEDDEYSCNYIQNGKHCTLKGVVVYPEFSLDMLK